MDPAELSRAFHQQLNEQGYAFHYAVIAEADNQHRLQRSRWALEAVEFPVEVRGRDTRVDIVLRHTRPATQAYMIVECKRANPAFSNWVFVRAPYVRRDPEQGIVLQRLDTTLRPTHSAVHRLGQIADGC